MKEISVIIIVVNKKIITDSDWRNNDVTTTRIIKIIILFSSLIIIIGCNQGAVENEMSIRLDKIRNVIEEIQLSQNNTQSNEVQKVDKYTLPLNYIISDVLNSIIIEQEAVVDQIENDEITKDIITRPSFTLIEFGNIYTLDVDYIEIDFSLGRTPRGRGFDVLIKLNQNVYNLHVAEFILRTPIDTPSYLMTTVMHDIEPIEQIKEGQYIFLRAIYHVGTMHRFGIIFDDEFGEIRAIAATQPQIDGRAISIVEYESDRIEFRNE